MSHTLNIRIEMHDLEALELACQRLELKMVNGIHQLYSSKEEGIGILLPNWRYPIVIKNDGTISYDNYNGNWGDIAELNKLKAYYGIEKAKIEARKKGFTVFENYNEEKKELELIVKMRR